MGIFVSFEEFAFGDSESAQGDALKTIRIVKENIFFPGDKISGVMKQELVFLHPNN